MVFKAFLGSWGVLGGSLEVLRVLGGSLGGPWVGPWGSLGGPWGSLGVPWGSLGSPWGVPGWSLGVLGGSLGPILSYLGTSWSVLAPRRTLLGSSWELLGSPGWPQDAQEVLGRPHMRFSLFLQRFFVPGAAPRVLQGNKTCAGRGPWGVRGEPILGSLS